MTDLPERPNRDIAESIIVPQRDLVRFMLRYFKIPFWTDYTEEAMIDDILSMANASAYFLDRRALLDEVLRDPTIQPPRLR